MNALDNVSPDALPSTVTKLKGYLGDALDRRMDDKSQIVYLAAQDLATAIGVYCPSIGVAVKYLALSLVGNPIPESEVSQDAARALLKQKFPNVYSNYRNSPYKDVNLFLERDDSQSLQIYGYADWPDRNRVMHLESYIQRLKERLTAEGYASDNM